MFYNSLVAPVGWGPTGATKIIGVMRGSLISVLNFNQWKLIDVILCTYKASLTIKVHQMDNESPTKVV